MHFALKSGGVSAIMNEKNTEEVVVMSLMKSAADLLEALKRQLEQSAQDTDDAGAEPEEKAAETQTVRAVIKSAHRDMDPVTLQGWSRVIFNCEDGEERKMYFPGENGVYLVASEAGVLEHRDGAFVSFEKDSGEIVTPLFHLLPESEE